jgi:cytidylate kinase
MTVRALLLTIDGPAGAGKTTVSRLLAERLGYRYVDTGALYRGIALAASRAGIAPEDDARLAALCRQLELDFVRGPQGCRLHLNGEDIEDMIRTPEISMQASAFSARPVVRQFLLKVQHALGQAKAAVFEGRDMGTVVFPDADVKFFLEAPLAVRAQRRHRELEGKVPQTLDAVEAEMRRRDQNDCNRELAPLRPAADAVTIDSGNRSPAEVVDLMLAVIQRRTA